MACMRYRSCPQGHENHPSRDVCGVCQASISAPQPTKPCQFCGETVLWVAVKCKHCGEFFDESARSAATQASTPAVPSPAPAVTTRAPRGNSPKVVCPHCQHMGDVDVRQQKQKKGLSGGKATAAVLTAGISLLGTGLSRKETVSVAHCKNCGVRWAMG